MIKLTHIDLRIKETKYGKKTILVEKISAVEELKDMDA